MPCQGAWFLFYRQQRTVKQFLAEEEINICFRSLSGVWEKHIWGEWVQGQGNSLEGGCSCLNGVCEDGWNSSRGGRDWKERDPFEKSLGNTPICGRGVDCPSCHPSMRGSRFNFCGHPWNHRSTWGVSGSMLMCYTERTLRLKVKRKLSLPSWI